MRLAGVPFAILDTTVLRRLLVPVDFSACSLQAVRHACVLTRVVGGTLILLHVLDGRAGASEAETQLRALGEAARHPPQIRVVPVQQEDIARTILSVAQAERAELLILGTHGRNDLASGVLGQVAHRLILSADLPIQLVPERLRAAAPHSRWLVAAQEE